MNGDDAGAHLSTNTATNAGMNLQTNKLIPECTNAQVDNTLPYNPHHPSEPITGQHDIRPLHIASRHLRMQLLCRTSVSHRYLAALLISDKVLSGVRLKMIGALGMFEDADSAYKGRPSPAFKLSGPAQQTPLSLHSDHQHFLHQHPPLFAMALISQDEVDAITALIRSVGEAARRRQTSLLGLNPTSTIPDEHVTDVANQARKTIVKFLIDRYRGDRIVTDDVSAQYLGSSGAAWCVNALDGRNSFAVGTGHWSISIACHVSESAESIIGCVYFPVDDTMVVGGPDVPPTVDGNALDKLKPLGTSGPLVLLGEDPEGKIARCQTATSRSTWFTKQNSVAIHSLYQLALGNVDAFCIGSARSFAVMTMWPIIEALDGQCVYLCKKEDMGGEFPFVCGNAEFIRDFKEASPAEE